MGNIEEILKGDLGAVKWTLCFKECFSWENVSLELIDLFHFNDTHIYLSYFLKQMLKKE